MTTEHSAHTNNRAYVQGRTMTTDQLDSALSHPEVWTRFERYTTVGRVHSEGPMSETDALEEALMDLYAGARTRGFRLFRQYAQEAHVSRLKRIKANHHGSMKVDEYLPDLVGLRARLRTTHDLSILAHMLTAEQAGRNDENESRPAAIRLILARIDAVTKEDAVLNEFSGASEEEFAQVSENG